MEKNLEGKISDWLKTQGYPLEMKVASALREKEFFVSQSAYYADPETNTSREIDIIATKGDDIGFLEVALVIECKTSLDKPWVLFTSERHEEGRNKYFTFAILSEMARKKLVERSWANRALKEDTPLNWFNKPPRTAFGVTAAFSSGEDPAYKAVVGALKASIDWSRSKDEISSRTLQFVFPVVVFEGRLFESFLDANGQTITQEVEEGFITNHRSINGAYCSSVHIVIAKKLQDFCTEAFELTKQLQSILKPDLDEMYKEMMQR